MSPFPNVPLRFRVAFIGIAICVLLLITGFGWSRDSGMSYQTETVKRGDIKAVVAAIGTLLPRESVDVGAQVSGQITHLHIRLGDTVAKGQLLVEIDPIVLQTTVDAGRAELAGLRAQLAEQDAQHELAVQRHQRQQSLAKAKAISEESLQEAIANLKSSTARLAQLAAQIQQVSSNLKGNEAQLGFTRIYAPIAGTVISLDARQGQTLNAAYQTPTIMTIADLSQMTVWAKVSEADIRNIKVGMPASFIGLAGDERTWQGSVHQILPAPLKAAGSEGSSSQTETTPTVIQYPVLFNVDNSDSELKPQMTAQVNFTVAEAKDVFIVPLPALLIEKNRTEKNKNEKNHNEFEVKVLDENGLPQARSIKVGQRDRQNVQILAGLKQNEQVIVGELPQESERLFQW